jgi:hypothetical protein
MLIAGGANRYPAIQTVTPYGIAKRRLVVSSGIVLRRDVGRKLAAAKFFAVDHCNLWASCGQAAAIDTAMRDVRARFAPQWRASVQSAGCDPPH